MVVGHHRHVPPLDLDSTSCVSGVHGRDSTLTRIPLTLKTPVSGPEPTRSKKLVPKMYSSRTRHHHSFRRHLDV